MNICFIDNTDFPYNSKDIYSEKLRGAETVLINLSNSLSILGHKVSVINNCPKSEIINRVRWININNLKEKNDYDVVFVNGDCRLFNLVNSKKKILFSHSLQSIEKFIRKKQLFAYLKHKPIVCFLSKYHLRNRSKLLHLFGHINIRYAVDDIFLNTKIKDELNNNLAIFTSRADRNLELLINIWSKHIQPKNKNLKLLVTEHEFNIKNLNIIQRKLGNQNELIKDLLKSKVYLIRGHKAELFCLAAEEAKELCLPIVTMGKGCLAERVEHGKTGFVAKNEKEFAMYTLELFNNFNLWNEIRNYLIKNRGKKNWRTVSQNLLEQL